MIDFLRSHPRKEALKYASKLVLIPFAYPMSVHFLQNDYQLLYNVVREKVSGLENSWKSTVLSMKSSQVQEIGFVTFLLIPF